LSYKELNYEINKGINSPILIPACLIPD